MEGFFFSAKLGASLTTGYNWGQASSLTKSEQSTSTAHSVVPAGNFINS